MKRLLVVGAGASIEECRRSGNYANDPTWSFPLIRDFCNKLFDPTSHALLKATASYLQTHAIPFNPRLLYLEVGDTFDSEDIERGPIGVFLQLEAQHPELHNIERLSEHVWHQFGTDPTFWGAFIHDGIYLHLFELFTQQFGLGAGVPMIAGRKVASQLNLGDVVVNLNYDIAFDLALKQANVPICYAPETRPNTVNILKPHGSFNLYVNLQNGNYFFEEPDKILGSVGFPDPAGGYFHAQDGIIPPRLNKSYEQHPTAAMILNTGRPFAPRIVTFWGVGLTASDIDLMSLYREAVSTAAEIEFINPSVEAHQIAEHLLSKSIDHFSSLDEWFAVYGLS